MNEGKFGHFEGFEMDAPEGDPTYVVTVEVFDQREDEVVRLTEWKQRCSRAMIAFRPDVDQGLGAVMFFGQHVDPTKFYTPEQMDDESHLNAHLLCGSLLRMFEMDMSVVATAVAMFIDYTGADGLAALLRGIEMHARVNMTQEEGGTDGEERDTP